jgi:hypothetical protein
VHVINAERNVLQKLSDGAVGLADDDVDGND